MLVITLNRTVLVWLIAIRHLGFLLVIVHRLVHRDVFLVRLGVSLQVLISRFSSYGQTLLIVIIILREGKFELLKLIGKSHIWIVFSFYLVELCVVQNDQIRLEITDGLKDLVDHEGFASELFWLEIFHDWNLLVVIVGLDQNSS